MISGWWDNYPRDVIEQWEDLAKQSGRAGESKLVMGPWSHTAIDMPEQGDMKFPQAEDYSTKITLKFFDYYLRGIEDNGWKEVPKVSAFQCNESKWVGGESWEKLCGKGAAHYLHADGKIGTTRPGDATEETPLTRQYEYDPKDPSPTIGGQNLPPMTHGPKDVSKVEKRKDVLVYETEALKEPLAIRGVVELSVSFQCNGADTDIHVRLCDDDGEGHSYLVGETIQRAKLRDGKKVQLIKEGETVRLTLRFPDHAYTWGKGHKLKLIVTGGSAPRYEPNTHNGDDAFDKAKALDTEYYTLLVGDFTARIEKSDQLLNDNKFTEAKAELDNAAQLPLPDDQDRQLRRKLELWAEAVENELAQLLKDAAESRDAGLFTPAQKLLSEAYALPLDPDQTVRVSKAEDALKAALGGYKDKLFKQLEDCVQKGLEKEGKRIADRLRGATLDAGEQLRLRGLENSLTGESEGDRYKRLPNHLRTAWQDKFCKAEQLIEIGEEITALAVTPDGKFACVGTSSGRVYFHNLKRGTQLGSSRGGSRRITAMGISADGKYAASGNDDGNLVLFDLSANSVQASEMGSVGDDVYGLAFSNNSNVLFVATRALIGRQPGIDIGAEAVLDSHLEQRYETMCDPRLNGRQSIDLAFAVSELLRR